MRKAIALLSILGTLSATAATAGNLDSQPPVQLGDFSVTPHQIAVTRAIGGIAQELATPSEQNAAVPAEGKVSPALFDSFPATKHQASLGLAYSAPPSQ